MYFLRRAPYEGLARMRERGSRVTLVTRAMYIRTYVCTIKCGINTHDRVDRGGKGEFEEGDGDRQRAPLGDAGKEASHGGRGGRDEREGGDYERADRSL